MKNRRLLSLLGVALLSLAGCGNDEAKELIPNFKINKTYKIIIEELANYINNSHLGDFVVKPNDLYLWNVHGCYNGSYVFQYSIGVKKDYCPSPYYCESEITPGDGYSDLHYFFSSCYCFETLVYNNHDFYTPQDAYDIGLFNGHEMTLFNLTNISDTIPFLLKERNNLTYEREYRYNGQYSEQDLEVDKSFNSYLKSQNQSTKDYSCKWAYRYGTNGLYYDTDDINFAEIYSFTVPELNMNCGDEYSFSVTIDGVLITVHSNSEPIVWLKNQKTFISIEDAYSEGIINKSNLNCLNDVVSFIDAGTIGNFDGITYDYLCSL